MLVNTNYSFLVIVLFIQGDAKRFEDRTIHFWFNSAHVNTLDNRGYFLADEKDRRARNLGCRLRMFPMLVVEPLLGKLVSQNYLTEEGRRILLSEIPERVPKTWSASEYVAVARKARDKTNDLVWRPVPKELCKLSNMGFDIGLGHLD